MPYRFSVSVEMMIRFHFESLSPPSAMRQKRALSNPSGGLHDRLKCTKFATTAPSDAAKQAAHERLQQDPSEKILDDRPEPDLDIPPISLLYEGFGHFLDIMDGRGNVPGLADIDVRELHQAVDDLANTMTLFFAKEDDRRDPALPILNRIFSARKGTNIPMLAAAAIGSVRSDGHNIAVHGGGFSRCTI